MGIQSLLGIDWYSISMGQVWTSIQHSIQSLFNHYRLVLDQHSSYINGCSISIGYVSISIGWVSISIDQHLSCINGYSISIGYRLFNMVFSHMLMPLTMHTYSPLLFNTPSLLSDCENIYIYILTATPLNTT